MITLQLVKSQEEMKGVLALQQANLRNNITQEEAETQGFLMAEYDLDFLELLNQKSPGIIAKDGEKVVGYSLVALPETARQHPLLADLVQNIERCIFEGKPVENYAIVAQLCVSKEYRGQDLVQKLYGSFRDHYANRYTYCVTDVAQANHRSLKAHQKRGFQVIDTLDYGGIGWNIVLWDWNKKAF
ncbi:GNAT family N-acetyltransferase [Aquirufa antheringensis]|uniref:GNAT family N-acetyltransferase n=1 Tax=Aquirufa antheringensis TaxID=2516559 RepID=A0A4Q9BI46_9BACT|nr:GNAT family N-acetyltransferase [Aquirufa antheringensis]MCZ2485028.1 GNAT family N-acetyltransferase [Aquirufa antheringensis]TBH75333.1 GNAT family N-acetyltransferase [Aquirufa antheringensis]